MKSLYRQHNASLPGMQINRMKTHLLTYFMLEDWILACTGARIQSNSQAILSGQFHLRQPKQLALDHPLSYRKE